LTRIQVQTFRLPGWLAPILVLFALVLIPFLLTLALGLLALGLGAAAVRHWLLPPASLGDSRLFPGRGEKKPGDSPVIDVDYEVKDEHEKNQRR